MLIIGGISLYRSFAMYEEKKTFDVLKGKVPDFCSIVYKQEEWTNEINEKKKEIEFLNGTEPVLDNNQELIPVVIDRCGNAHKVNTGKKWYDYEHKEWANAVILTEEGKKQQIQDGGLIDEKYIESYFVWIPKYKYKIFDMGTYTGLTTTKENQEQAIEIIFGTENTTNEGKTNEENECATPTESGGTGTCKEGKWMTHPAFLAFEGTTGLWVGKFETGYNQDEDNSLKDTNSWKQTGAEKDTNEPTKVIIKPNVYSWRKITVGNAFNTSKQYKPELQSHMMKNTEWGAVAYLSHSKYGICDDDTCLEVRINNSSNFVTGVSAKIAPTTGYNEYKDYTNTTPGKANEKSNVYPTSVEASTTKNNSGIFDMSGGAWEYVAGYMSGRVGLSGLTESTDLIEENSKYFDKYTNSHDSHFYKRILGDATGEMGPFSTKTFNNSTNWESSWYEDYAWFVWSSIPWFLRGGFPASGVLAGVFAFNRTDGGSQAYRGYRVALAPSA